jgi:predicted small secreted protein
MRHTQVLFGSLVLLALLSSACNTVTPTPGTDMKDGTAMPDAMVETATPDAMMHDTATPDAMMDEASATPDDMMMHDTATPDMMMEATATP